MAARASMSRLRQGQSKQQTWSSPPDPSERPVIPALLPYDADIFQVHASAYRNPDQLPEGAVLIIGSGAWGHRSPMN